MYILAAYAIIATAAGAYRIYEKAGFPGWSALVPFYSAVVFLRLVGRPAWWVWLLIVPGVNLVIGVIARIDLADRFDRGPAFGVGLILLPFVFFPMLGFGPARYHPS
jgi:hypothetical protein